MRKQCRRVVPAAVLALALTALWFAGPAQAKLVGEFTKFQYCPYENTEVKKCLYSVTEGGEVKLGTKTVPIEKKVVLQGGFGKPDKTTKISVFYGATGGKPTLAPVSQNVPGGLAGIVPEASSPFLVKKLIKFFFENSLTGLGSTLELAGSPSEIQISESFLARAENVALKLPVKIHLENPFLGSNCYVGSSTKPIIWNLTTGATSPPGPNTSISGNSGTISFLEEGLILHLAENKLVDNAWAAPSATGCGGILAFLVNPIVNASAGLPATAGHNTAILKNTIDISTAAAVKMINEQNP
jgi:hypothetical protein